MAYAKKQQIMQFWEKQILQPMLKILKNVKISCYPNILKGVYSRNKLIFYQCCFTKQLVAMYEIANCHVKVRRSAAPVGYFGERIYSQDVLPSAVTNHINNCQNAASSNNKRPSLISAETTRPTNNFIVSVIISTLTV